MLGVGGTVEAARTKHGAREVHKRPVHVTDVLQNGCRVGSSHIVALLAHEDLLVELGALRGDLGVTAQTVHVPAL